MVEFWEVYGIVFLWSLPVAFLLVLVACEIAVIVGAMAAGVMLLRRAVKGVVCRYKVYRARKRREKW